MCVSVSCDLPLVLPHPHSRGHEILKCTLPAKFEHVLLVRPSPVQAALYDYNMNSLQQGGTSTTAGPLKAFAVCTKVRGGGEVGERGKGRGEGERNEGRGEGERGEGLTTVIMLVYILVPQIWNHPDIYYNEAKVGETKKSSPVGPSLVLPPSPPLLLSLPPSLPSLPPSLPHSLTHSLIHSLTHSLTLPPSLSSCRGWMRLGCQRAYYLHVNQRLAQQQRWSG